MTTIGRDVTVPEGHRLVLVMPEWMQPAELQELALQVKARLEQPGPQVFVVSSDIETFVLEPGAVVEVLERGTVKPR